MTWSCSVDLDDCDHLIAAAAILVGDDAGKVMALLMTTLATVLLDANSTPAKAADLARAAGPPLAEMVEALAKQRLAECREGGTA
jgi:propanediol dehydratase large subunit